MAKKHEARLKFQRILIDMALASLECHWRELRKAIERGDSEDLFEFRIQRVPVRSFMRVPFGFYVKRGGAVSLVGIAFDRTETTAVELHWNKSQRVLFARVAKADGLRLSRRAIEDGSKLHKPMKWSSTRGQFSRMRKGIEQTLFPIPSELGKGDRDELLKNRPAEIANLALHIEEKSLAILCTVQFEDEPKPRRQPIDPKAQARLSTRLSAAMNKTAQTIVR